VSHDIQPLDDTDLALMRQAIDLARSSDRYTHPNPKVGCLIVKDGNVIASGVTRGGRGADHAEIEALTKAGDAARGATAYVTLEPCCHHGTTPPCTDALIDAGVAKVVIAMADPDPRVSGGGIDVLEEAGVKTILADCAAEARSVNAGFFSRLENGRPWVRVKLAATIDGRTATRTGESQWITGEAARADVQQLRQRADAIITGIGTVLDDDPRLTVRGPEVPIDRAQPLRVVVDSAFRTPVGANLLHEPGQVLVAGAIDGPGADVLAGVGAEVVSLPGLSGQVDLKALLSLLGTREINEVHSECGARLAGGLVADGLVDELIVYLAPRILGDCGRGMFHLPGLERLVDAVNFSISDIVKTGEDIRITLTPETRSGR